MKEKKLITISLLSILLFNVGCSKLDPKVKKDIDNKVKYDIVMDSGSQYRQRLQLLKKFKKNIPMPFVDGVLQEGGCEKKNYDADTQTICKEQKIPQEIETSNSCEDSFGLMATKTIEVTENNQTIRTLYQCKNKNKKKTKDILKHYFLKDKRYISVSPITNQSGKKNLPTNFDLMIKNTINTIGQNYTLIEATKTPKGGEYRIEGAITGLDSILNVNDNLGGQLYQTGGAKANLVGGKNNNIDVKSLSMDFIVKKYNSILKRWEYIPNISTSNQILVSKSKTDNTFRFALLGAGIQAGTIISKSNGLSHVSRALMESSLIELLAKLDDLPYWSFLPNRWKHYTFPEENWKNKLLENYKENLSDPYLSFYFKEIFVKNLLENYYHTKMELKDLIRRYKDEYIDDEDINKVGFHNNEVDATLIVHLLERVPNKLVTERTAKEKPKETNEIIYILKDEE